MIVKKADQEDDDILERPAQDLPNALESLLLLLKATESISCRGVGSCSQSSP
jgi:hypothetical protein